LTASDAKRFGLIDLFDFGIFSIFFNEAERNYHYFWNENLRIVYFFEKKFKSIFFEFFLNQRKILCVCKRQRRTNFPAKSKAIQMRKKQNSHRESSIFSVGGVWIKFFPKFGGKVR
jgi:hypothetical protein